MIYLRTILFYLGEALSTVPFLLIALVALPFPPKTRSKLIAGWAMFVIWWLKVCCRVTHELQGEENIPDTPAVFASNHQSTWETISMQTFLPALAWVLKKELFKIPVFGWGLWATRPIAIDRQEHASALDQVIRKGQKKLAEGRYVLIFPEGTRTSYGVSARYKKGAVMLARAAKVPLVPIAHDAGKYWSKNSWWIRPGVIRCIIGPEIELDGKPDRQVTDEIKDWISAQGL
ncbi:MAG: 1-acyl-sn-glycerol-3-phosphate acyltransferase [Gammaproteobacteria bacterium]|nr:1-acyl-sn-glycerol-3-phosphate acyltransferase [Gammaproteobacteria bacterium]